MLNTLPMDRPNINQNQENNTNHVEDFLPIQLTNKLYTKWDCDIQVKQTSKGYFKCLEGKGQVQFVNGNKFKGSFYNGLMNGQGEFIWSNGLKYKGTFYLNSITGKGHYQWPDGSTYEGQLLNGKRHGKGDYYCAKDKSKYYGEFKNGVKHGHGLLQFNEQSMYEGDFNQGFRHGKGKMKYASGNVYEGQWNNDKKNGYGVMNWFTQNQKYQGQWKNDQQHGFGTYYWFDGKIQYKLIKNIYKGNWENGQRNGYGAFFFSNGCRYEGYFSSSCKNGFGLVMDQNGNIKLENFEKNKLLFSIPQSNSYPTSSQKVPSIESAAYISSVKKTQPAEKSKVAALKNSEVVNKEKGNKVLPLIKKSGNPQKFTSSNNSKKQNEEKIEEAQKQRLDSSIIVDNQKSIISTSPLGSLLSNNLNCKQIKNQIEQNIYSKCLDIMEIDIHYHESEHKGKMKNISICKVDRNIMNLLLRENSKLKVWYKYCCAFGANSLTSNKDNFYSGLTIENLWKLVKDIKISDEYVTISKLNRQFFKGWKSTYDIILPNQKKLEFMKNYLCEIKDKNNNQSQKHWQNFVNNVNANYSNIQWIEYYNQLNKTDQFNVNSLQSSQIDLNNFNDVHQPKKIILFRHFVTYLLRIAFLQTQKTLLGKKQENVQKQFKNHIQKLFKTIGLYHDATFRDSRTFNNQTNDNISYVSKQRSGSMISEDYSKLNRELFLVFTHNQRSLNNSQDKTVTVKYVYEILEKFNILKQVNQKILFMQKIERMFECQYKFGSLFKKDTKVHFTAIEKVIHTSPYFTRLLNYPMIQKDFEQLIYLAVNRKVNSSNKQDAIRKYKEIIDSIKDYVMKQSGLSQSRQSKQNPQKSVLKMKSKKTSKDLLKQELIRKAQIERIAKQQAQRKRKEIERQAKQNHLMSKEDFRWQQDSQSEQSQDYFD